MTGKAFLPHKWSRWYSVAAVAVIVAVVGYVAWTNREPPLPEDAGTVARVRVMTNDQYSNMIANIFGSDIRVGTVIPPLQRTDGLLALSAASVGITSGQVQEFQRAATTIAAQVLDDGDLERHTPSRRDALVPCKPASLNEPDDACAEKFVRTTGLLLFRRPLSDDEVTTYVQHAHGAAEQLGDFYAGLQIVLEGMLINPRVLLIEDTTEPDPDRPGHERLDAYALASRLSLFLWNSVPDEQLLMAAANGDLHTKRGRKREVERMLASPRLEQGVRAFFDDMFAFDHFNVLTKDAMAYPMITGATLADAREQTLRTVVDHLLVKKADYRDLFTTRSTFLSPALGAVYQEPAVPGWTPYEFPEGSERAGIVTHVSFLALHSHPARSSPTLRGEALRELFLCQQVPPPPPDVDFSAVEDADESIPTARERLEIHRSNPSCAGCHRITDPIGLALEKYDGAGRFRETERGAPIDVRGDLDGKQFDDIVGLGQALRDHRSVPSCLVQRVYSYATGGPLKSAKDPMISILNEKFVKSDYQVVDLLREIALSEAFVRVIEQPSAAPARQTIEIPSSEPDASNEAEIIVDAHSASEQIAVVH